MKTDEVCDRPLETFGADTPMFLGFYRSLGNTTSMLRAFIIAWEGEKHTN